MPAAKNHSDNTIIMVMDGGIASIMMHKANTEDMIRAWLTMPYSLLLQLGEFQLVRVVTYS